MIEKVRVGEIRHVEWIAKRLNEVTGLGEEKKEILLMAANLLVFLGGFHVLRGWRFRDVCSTKSYKRKTVFPTKRTNFI